ncbi:MAG: hypothetical protein CVU05_04325 [Bacteroidetes bacterium HGW-Bacteroidetes-21]|jgi:hypothetical protein|nr:MAG: hypothetical protein CVU05_04325 [Bacteroidetes bacterium HGW-Bacteroidetes-21]
MRKISFAFLLFVLVIPVAAQNLNLKLKNKSSGKESILEEGKRVRIFPKEGYNFVGNITLPDTTHIIIDGDTLLLSDIEKIRTKSLGSIIAGSVLTLVGTGSAGLGSLIIASTFAKGGLVVLLGIILGGPLIVVGVPLAIAGVLFLSIGKNYKREKWNYKIVPNLSPG